MDVPGAIAYARGKASGHEGLLLGFAAAVAMVVIGSRHWGRPYLMILGMFAGAALAVAMGATVDDCLNMAAEWPEPDLDEKRIIHG